MFLNLQAGRKVTGVLRGYDVFLNVVLDDAMDETVAGEKLPMGTVVSYRSMPLLLAILRRPVDTL